MTKNYNINNDILIVAYFMNENGWEAANKSGFQRILYFSAVLSPIFVPHETWTYSFSNTMFGPYNNEISKILGNLSVKGLLSLEERKFYSNRMEERYKISEKGSNECINKLFLINSLDSKVAWFETIVKVLSIYGESFISKLVKEDPNVLSFNLANNTSKLPTGNTEDNLSMEFFEFIKNKGKERLNLNETSDQDYLLIFFDILYRRYKGGK